jgi:hypothetical protein
MPRKSMSLETRTLHNLINCINTIVQEIEAAGPVTVDMHEGRDRASSTEKAVLARSLLRAAEMSALLAQEFQVRYWQVKGHSDPR